MPTIKELLDQVESSVLEEERLLFGAMVSTPGSSSGSLPEIKAANGLPLSDKINELVALIQAEPILLGPVLAFAQRKKAEIDFAKLSVLYSPEEIDELRARLAQ